MTERLVQAAIDAAANAYAPYSNFRVGAVVVASDGAEFTGANVENASYPIGSCAETNAINHAVSTGARDLDVLVVACVDAVDIEHAYPCGGCRQVMKEFGVKRLVVTTGDPSTAREHSLEEMLPHGFSL